MNRDLIVRVIDPLLGVGILTAGVIGLQRGFWAAIRVSARIGEPGS